MLKRLWALITRRRRETVEPDLTQMHLAIHNHRAQAGGPEPHDA
jgi:hypothetical protein